MSFYFLKLLQEEGKERKSSNPRASSGHLLLPPPFQSKNKDF